MKVGIGSGSSKQLAVVEEGEGKIVAGYDFTKAKVGSGVGGGGLSPTPNRALTLAQDPVSYEFTKFGDGECKDAKYRTYDIIAFGFGVDEYNTRADACGVKCSECPGQGQIDSGTLRGFSIFSNTCYCLIDDSSYFTSDACPSASYFEGSGAGKGPISQTLIYDDDGFVASGRMEECWKADIKTKQPTASPSLEPSVSTQPSTSSQPSSEASSEPSSEPSLEPSISLQPSSEPSLES